MRFSSLAHLILVDAKSYTPHPMSLLLPASTRPWPQWTSPRPCRMLDYDQRRQLFRRKTRMGTPDRKRAQHVASHAGMRLSTRVQVMMALSTAVVFTVIATIVGVGVTQYSHALAADEAKRQLEMIRVQFDLEAGRLDALMAGFYGHGTVSSDGADDAAAALERWLAAERPPA